jgi:hypothetical protein
VKFVLLSTPVFNDKLIVELDETNADGVEPEV